jgi:hypothetical protein
MTDNDIVKTLELCRENEKHSTCEHCSKCPFSTCDLVADEENCLDALYRRSINLINRQKVEIERLKGMVSQNEGVLPQYEALVRAEAIKEFAERLKEIDDYVSPLDIDNLVKEMTEEQP